MKKYHIGYTCGVFDLFHVGHLNLLERCKSMCDILIVGVCDDKYVTDIKRKQPVYPEDQRVRILNALKNLDKTYSGKYIIICNHFVPLDPSYSELIFETKNSMINEIFSLYYIY